MAERLNNHNLLPYGLGDFEIGAIRKVHPTLSCPDSLTNPIKVALTLLPDAITPTGLRTLSFSNGGSENEIVVAKGYFPSPVHIYGERAEENQRKWLRHFQKQGEFGGRATEDDVKFEYSVLERLRESNPEVVADPAAPVWQLVGVGQTGEEIKIWREDDNKPRKRVIIFRRFPFTQWRATDPFMVGGMDPVERELNRLQKSWNVTNRKGVYIRAGKRLATAFGYLYNANVVHGNLYWRWFDSNLERTYARPNPHNVAFDGSIGDFEIPDKLYGVDDPDIHLRETTGAFSIYALLIAKINPELLNDSDFVARFITHFRNNLPVQLAQQLTNSEATRKVIRDYEERLNLASSGRRTMNGMECFDDHFFASQGGSIISVLRKLVGM